MLGMVCLYNVGNGIFLRCWEWHVCTMLEMVSCSKIGNCTGCGFVVKHPVCYKMLEMVFLYDVGNGMLLRNWKLYVARFWKWYVCTMLEIVCLYDVGNGISVRCQKWYVCTMLEMVFLYDVGSRILLQNWKSYVVPCGKSYVFTILEIVC